MGFIVRQERLSFVGIARYQRRHNVRTLANPSNATVTVTSSTHRPGPRRRPSSSGAGPRRSDCHRRLREILAAYQAGQSLSPEHRREALDLLAALGPFPHRDVVAQIEVRKTPFGRYGLFLLDTEGRLFEGVTVVGACLPVYGLSWRC